MKPGANSCGTKRIVKVKPDGSMKSRLLVQGFTQTYTQGELHEDIFIRAPAPHPPPRGKVYRL